jgi:hypothetical protein
MKNWRRYEILLPLRFNDGKPVPKALLAQAVQELEDRFGAVSCESHISFADVGALKARHSVTI